MPRLRNVLMLSAALVLMAAPAADARKARLSWVKCYRLCADKRTVAPGGTVKVAGLGFRKRMRVSFRARTRSGRRTTRVQRLSSTRVLARVPRKARWGRVFVRIRRGVRTNRVGPLRVRRQDAPPAPAPEAPPAPPPSGSAFDGDAMWIWNMPRTEGGDPAAILREAREHGIETVFVKSGDGTRFWSQFSPALVSALKAGGLRVCGWQYVYGSNPRGEAAVAARAADAGADCFIIDAEAEYEGRYAEAQTYVRALREAVGPDYPLGMSSFPYVDYHPSFPYSEFFAPGGAQFNVPQVYWKTIGDSVDESLAHTYRFNRPYARTIAPAGQAYDGVSSRDIVRFRQLTQAYGAPGINWWAWEHATGSMWSAIGQPFEPLAGPAPAGDYATMRRGARGDLVVWAQAHLEGAGHRISADGAFGPATEAAVESFQSTSGLPVTGQVDTATWQALVDNHEPARQNWKRAGVSAARAGGVSGPAKSAHLPAKGYEVPSGD